MEEITRDQIFQDILKLLEELSEDWEYSGTITGQTYLIQDLGFDSIDIFILCTNLEQYYNQPLPFAQFLAEIGEREVRDIRIDELVEFFHRHLNNGNARE